MAPLRLLLLAHAPAILLAAGAGLAEEEGCNDDGSVCLGAQRKGDALIQRQARQLLATDAVKEEGEEDAGQAVPPAQPLSPPAKLALNQRESGQTVYDARAPRARSAKGQKGDNEKALEFCDKESLLTSRGVNHSAGSTSSFQQSIIADIENELSRNSVDQMAKDIFSFYICVRWVPDDVFWRVAKEEITNDIIKTVIDHQKTPEEAISELYQTFKFIPLLCTRNMAVYEKKDPTTYTYFPVFKDKVLNVSRFLEQSASKHVWESLKRVDESFCNSDSMNSAKCDTAAAASEWANKVNGYFGNFFDGSFSTKQDRWAAMHKVYQGFKLRDGSQHDWNTDFLGWKANFPYHSFIAKPGGASHTASPKSTERFLVCFGKRVASELHRRPVGNNIMTDQNSVGCHGWWDATKASQMLSRMVALWKPPTCQLAEKTYEMKKQILKMYTKMNEDLYGALPSMLQDEELFEKGVLEEALAGPQPYNVASATLDGTKYYSGMRVAKIGDKSYSKGTCAWWRPAYFCKIKIKHGTAGTVEIKQGQVKVRWESDSESVARTVAAADVQIVAEDYGKSTPGILDAVGNALESTGQWIGGAWQSMWGNQYSNLAELLSGSLTKWVVCGVAENASYDELDNWLGTEDEAFREHVKEAYSKWTGYKKIPGEECNKDPLADYATCKTCDYVEMHTDHPEKHWRDDGQKENFMCPLIPPMAPAEQLDVWKQKKGTCLLAMTSEHQRQFQWHYQGYHPARKQNNLQGNDPRVEYQLVKLLDISDKVGPQQVSFGRSCTIEEQNANPRFCGTPEPQSKWPSVADMAQAVSGWLGGSLGMPYGAIHDLIGNYQRIVSKNSSDADKAKDAAVALGEKGWEALLGLGRLAHDTAQRAANQALYALPEADNRHARLERGLFGFSHGGELLHGLSYQAPIGKSNTTSNSRDRYRRYVVNCDCTSFDPGLELALRWQWSEVALRVVREAARHITRILDEPDPVIEARSEARLFYRQNAEAANSTYFLYGASVRPIVAGGDSQTATITCDVERSWWKSSCIPEDKCKFKNWWSFQCVPKAEAVQSNDDEWKIVSDGKLAEELGGNPLGQTDVTSLKALTVHFHCGKKSSFGAKGPPSPVPANFRKCVEEGVKANAAMKAKEPWRLYFPDEVVVVAEFGTLDTAKCRPTTSAVTSQLCGSGGVDTADLDSHIRGDLRSGGPSGGAYRGLRTGSGFPKGTVKEITLRPEDVLTVTGLLLK